MSVFVTCCSVYAVFLCLCVFCVELVFIALFTFSNCCSFAFCKQLLSIPQYYEMEETENDNADDDDTATAGRDQLKQDLLRR